MNYLTDVKPLEDSGLSDSDIASLLSASTSNNILMSDLENFLDFENLASRNAITGSWEGILPDEIMKNNFGLANGLSALFNHINKPRSLVIDTTVSPWSTDALALTAGLLSFGLITQEQRETFYDLAGGLLYENINEQDIINVRTAWQSDEDARQAAEDERQAMEAARLAYTNWSKGYIGRSNSFIPPVLDSGTIDNAGLIAALRALADDLEANPLSE